MAITMRMNRSSVALAAALAGVIALAGSASRASAQQTYPQTLYWGAGLMDIPVAWVAPVSGDFALSYSGQSFNSAPTTPQLSEVPSMNTNGAFSLSFWGRVEIGLAIYSSNPEWGVFANGLLLDEEKFRPKSGAEHWVPSLAIGLRNVGPYTHVDRYTFGYELFPAPPGSTSGTVVHDPDSLHQNFKTAMTVYGVVTKSFALNEIKDGWGKTNFSVSLGYGNGLFSDDGGLGKAYSNQSTGGIFGGIKVDFYPSERSILSFMLEQNAWQWNLGGSYDYRGLRIGLYYMNMFPGAVDTGAAASLYNYSKFAFSLSWQSNVLGVVHGDFLQQQEQQLQAEVASMQKEIAARQQRIAGLELEIQRYEAQNLLEIEQRRAAAEQALRQEKDALQQLEDRLQRLEQNSPTAPPPPPSKPPR
jgi:hypothetical protein